MLFLQKTADHYYVHNKLEDTMATLLSVGDFERKSIGSAGEANIKLFSPILTVRSVRVEVRCKCNTCPFFGDALISKSKLIR